MASIGDFWVGGGLGLGTAGLAIAFDVSAEVGGRLIQTRLTAHDNLAGWAGEFRTPELVTELDAHAPFDRQRTLHDPRGRHLAGEESGSLPGRRGPERHRQRQRRLAHAGVAGQHHQVTTAQPTA
jgi:hypothetical protein